MDCTKTIGPAENLKAVVRELPAGAVLCLGDGVYPANLHLEKSITIRGSGGAILDGGGRSSTLTVDDSDAEITLEKITLRNGSGGGMGAGGNLTVADAKSLSARECVFDGGEADANGGGAVLVSGGKVLLERCRMTKNRGARAQAILIDGFAQVILRGAQIHDNDGDAPAVMVAGVGRLTVEESSIANAHGAAIDLKASPKGTPKLSVKGSTLSSALPAGAVDAGGNTIK